MALSDAEIQATKVPYGKNQFKVSDGGGLYLLVKSSGRYWKLAYRFDGKQKTLAFGVYPLVSVETAREKRDEAKALLVQNIDPGQLRKQERMEQREAVVAHGAEQQNNETYEPREAIIRQPVAMDQIKQQMIETRRLHILQILVDSKSYSLNENDLQLALDAKGYRISSDRLRTDIAWLFEQQAVEIKTDALWFVYLTQAGLNAAQGRMWMPGILRPEVEQ